MGFDLEKRIATELHRLDNEAGNDVQRTQQIERVKKLAEEIKNRFLGDRGAEAAGKQTLQEVVESAIQRFDEITERARGFQTGQRPWQQSQRATFDDYRATALREVLGALSTPQLRSQTIAAADPEIAGRSGAKTPTRKSVPRAGGQAMWHAAERRAATLYRHAMDQGEVASDDPIVDEALERCGNGQPLPGPVRKKMEAEFGVSFARVRIHTDSVAANAAKAVHAEAFTVGDDIFFSNGAFDPSSVGGQKLIAHELTHVVQAMQGRITGGDKRVSQPGEALEHEAEQRAEKIAARGSSPQLAVEPTSDVHAHDAAKATKPDRGGAELAEAPAPMQSVPAKSSAVMRRALADAPTSGGPPTDHGANAPRGPDGRKRRPPIKFDVKQHPDNLVRTANAGISGMSHALGKMDAASKTARATMNQTVDAAVQHGPKTGKKADHHAKNEAKDHKKHRAELKAHAKKHHGKKHGKHKHKGKGHHAHGHAGGQHHGLGDLYFKPIKDWNKLLPEKLPDQDARETKRILALIKKKVTKERNAAAKSLQSLKAAQMHAAAQVRALKPSIQGQIRAAERSALGKVSGAEASQAASVHSHVAGVKAQVRGTQSSMTSRVNQSKSQALSQINQAFQQANQKLTQDHQQAMQDLQQKETAEVAKVADLFSQCEDQIRQLGAQKASEATALGDMALPYSGDKLDAARDAAHQVAEKYAAAMPEQAEDAASKIHEQMAGVQDQVRELGQKLRDKADDVFKNAQKALQNAHKSAVQAANAAARAAVSQIAQTGSSTIAGLSALEASSVAGIHQQAAGARAGITSAAQSAIASVGAQCDKAASGIAGGADGLIKGARKNETPDAKQIAKEVKKAGAELKGAVSSTAAGLRQTASQSAQGLTAQATGAAQGMAQAAQQANSGASQQGAAAKQQMTAAAQGASQQLRSISTGFKTNATQMTHGASEAFKALSDKATESYDKQNSQLTTKLGEMVESVRGKMDAVVPDKERTQILAEAKKAADAVPDHWWQKVAAFVVKIVVAVVVAVAVGALIAATGGLAAPLALGAVVLIGAAGGAATAALGKIAENLIMGRGAFDNWSWSEIGVAALAGGLSAGAMSAITGVGTSAGSSLLSEGLAARGVLGSGVQGAFSSGASGLANFGIRAGVDFTVGMGTDAAAQLIVTGKYDFSMENLVSTAVSSAWGQRHAPTHGGTSGGNPTENIRIDGGDLSGGGHSSGSHSSSSSTGSHSSSSGHGDASTSTGSHSSSSGHGDASTSTGHSSGGHTTPTSHADAPSHGSTTSTSGHGEPGHTTPSHPAGRDPSNGGRTSRDPGSGRTDAGEPHTTTERAPNEQQARDNNNNDRSGNGSRRHPPAEHTPGERTPGERTGGQRTGEEHTGTQRRGDEHGGRERTGDEHSASERGTERTGERTGSERNGGEASRTGREHTTANEHGGRTSEPHGPGANEPRRAGHDEGHNGGRKGETEHGDHGAHGRDPAHANDTHGRGHEGGGERGHGEGAESSRGGHGDPAAAREAKIEGELSAAGYHNASRAAADRAVRQIEEGHLPRKGDVRDTEANQRGLHELQRIEEGKLLSPELKERFNHDLAERLREKGAPTGNLDQDIRETLQHERTADMDNGRVKREDASHAKDGPQASKDRARLPADQQVKYDAAWDFYRTQGMPDARIEGHLRGIDFAHPVEVVTLPKGTIVQQTQPPGAPQGSYYAPPGTEPSRLGISPRGDVRDAAGNVTGHTDKVSELYRLTEDVQVLRSTAGRIEDNWSMHEVGAHSRDASKAIPFLAEGGGTQYFTTREPAIERVGGGGSGHGGGHGHGNNHGH